MPKELTHWMLAERAYAVLGTGNPMKGIIEANHDLYLAGAVLPDTLMHLFRGPHAATALALARRFHDPEGNSYAPLIRAEERFPDGLPPDLLATLLGVLAHMQADIVFHPYVFAVAGISAKGRHYRLETAIDVSLMRSGWTPPARHLCDLITPVTKETLVSACCLLFDPGEELSRRSMAHALQLHCSFQSKYDSTFWKVTARLLGSLPGSPLREKQHLFYPLNMQREDEMITGQPQWLHPVTGEQRCTRIEELADQAVQQAAAAMERIGEMGSLSAALADPPGANLLTGMHGVMKREMGCLDAFPQKNRETDREKRPEKHLDTL
jgi:hypothetical protein